jgi:hypothetical protein
METLSLRHLVPTNCSLTLVHCCLLGSFVLLLRHEAGHKAIHDKQLQGQGWELQKYGGLLGTPHLHWFICRPELPHAT